MLTIIWTMFFDDGLPLLSRAECDALLASANVGRMSLTLGALPVVLPVTYQYLGGDIIIGMHDGPALRALTRPNIIGVGVDNANAAGPDWAVLVIGRATQVTDPDEHAQFHALALAAPTRTTATHYVRLRPDHLSGYHTTTPTRHAVHEQAQRHPSGGQLERDPRE